MSWQEQAACKDMDADVFFPPDTESKHYRWSPLEAKLVCKGCPVRGSCLQAAITGSETDGVWGGLDEQERAALAGKARRPNPNRRVCRQGQCVRTVWKAGKCQAHYLDPNRCAQPRCKRQTDGTWCDLHAERLRGLVA
jgi:WhiB family redox-sensing transcriptional regulator